MLPLETAPASGRAAGPFLKWAGGKTRLLSQLDPCFPERFGAYFEPFMGSAAVFFHLRRTRGGFAAELGDTNADLVNCYRVVQGQVEALLPLLHEHRRLHGREHYYRVRGLDPERLSACERAARLIYLNKTCYNGLYRINSKGRFNVPMGRYANPGIFTEEGLRAAGCALRGARIRTGDFALVLEHARGGDLVYFDPPYHTETNGFTGYAVSAGGRAGFGAEEHARLAEVARVLDARGCRVVVSNSDTAYVRRLYRGFTLRAVRARRVINSDAAGRGPVNELVIRNGPVR